MFLASSYSARPTPNAQGSFHLQGRESMQLDFNPQMKLKFLAVFIFCFSSLILPQKPMRKNPCYCCKDRERPAPKFAERDRQACCRAGVKKQSWKMHNFAFSSNQIFWKQDHLLSVLVLLLFMILLIVLEIEVFQDYFLYLIDTVSCGRSSLH